MDYAGIRINIVDTPGHADFGGEVERSLNLVDAVLLLVDAAEGPLPQTRYVLQKAMARRLPVVVALNKIDRGDARPAEVLDDVYELFMDLGADAHQIEFPVVYTNAKAATATRDLAEPGTNLRPLLDLLVEVTPPPAYTPGHPLQLLVTNLSANEYVGRMAVGRVVNGSVRVGQRISVVREEPDDASGTIEPGRTVTLTGTVTSLQTAHGIERIDIEEAGPGDIVSVAGLPEVTIGDTLTEPSDPRPLPRIEVDEPTLRMTFGVNTSPLSGREGKYLTSRQLRARLEKEILGNVAIQFFPTETGDTYEVRGRGELQLAVLVEQMRREGYELQVSRPEVILHTVGGHVQEPYERITIDIPPDYIGEIQTALAGRKGRLEQMTTDADGRVRMEFVLPVRGLIGYRGQLLTETRGTALLHQIGEGYGPWAGEVTHRTNGVLVADRAGTSNAYALFSLQERSELFIGSGADVYEGMVVGENARSGDMDVNVTKEKKLTNIRTHAHDEALRLTPPRPMTLETAIEFIGDDELVEVTPGCHPALKRCYPCTTGAARRASARTRGGRGSADRACSRSDGEVALVGAHEGVERLRREAAVEVREVRAVAAQDRADHLPARGVGLLRGDHRVPAPRLQLVAPEVRRLVHLRELDEAIEACGEAVVGPTAVDPQRGIFADEDVDRVAAEASRQELGPGSVGGGRGGEHAHEVVGGVAQQPASGAGRCGVLGRRCLGRGCLGRGCLG